MMLIIIFPPWAYNSRLWSDCPIKTGKNRDFSHHHEKNTEVEEDAEWVRMDLLKVGISEGDRGR